MWRMYICFVVFHDMPKIFSDMVRNEVNEINKKAITNER